MQIFFFEYATAGGAWDSWHIPDLVHQLRAEGGAMHAALANDLRDAGHHVVSLIDVACGNERKRLFQAHAHTSDAVLLLAPEIAGILLGMVELVESWQRMLLSPGSELVRIASDKHSTAEQLRAANVPAPVGLRQPAGKKIAVPWSGASICKPCDGAGSWNVRAFESSIGPLPYDARLERFHSGTPASVGILCGPNGLVPLEPCFQRLGGESGFEYQGGAFPLPQVLADRARALALRAMSALPPTVGFVGIDLVLGEASDGSEDVVIEVNPRLTTSYIGLRQAYRENLAAAMIEGIQGNPVQLSIAKQSLEFSTEPMNTCGTARQCLPS